MKKASILCICFIILIGATSVATKKEGFTSVTIDTLLIGKFSIRAITISEGKVYYAGNKSKIGFIRLEKSNEKINTAVVNDSVEYEFRSIAATSKHVFALNIGNPAKLFRYSKNLLQDKTVVYEEKGEKVFYDSMQFWNDNEGIAIGDPTENCFSVIITRDGGQTWKKTSCANLPKLADGEAAFAASNTNIIIKGNKTWLVSGGKKARVFYSPDKGITWKVFETPIVQGEAMTGVFTADFYDGKIGCIAGGNYEKPTQNFQNKALTTDGGKTWKLIGENNGFGYASCIQFLPKSNGNALVCVGSSGIYYSNDKGASWKQMSPDNFLYTLRFVDEKTAIAAGKDKIIRLKFH